MTKGLLTSARTKSKLLHKKLQKPTEHNINLYKQFLNKYNKLKKIMKQTYFQNMLNMNKFNMKKTWQILRKAIGKENNKVEFPLTFNINNKQVSNKMEIAESFNNYFANIGKITSLNVPKSNIKYTKYLNKSVPNSMYMDEVDDLFIMNIVKHLKPKTSCGFDEISTKLVKETITNIIHPMTHIVNRSLSTGIVPDQLKMAKVIPV